MTRKNQIGSGPNLRSNPELLEQIVSEAVRMGPLPYELWRQEFPGQPFPGTFQTPDRLHQFRATPKSMAASAEIASQVYAKRTDLRQSHDEKSFREISHLAVGGAIKNATTWTIGTTDPVGDAFFEKLAEEYQSELARLIETTRGDLVRHIPCELFDPGQGVPAFAIGPVTFMPRQDWIANFVIVDAQRRFVGQVEQKSLSVDDLWRLGSGQEGDRDAFTAWEVLKFLRAFSWVGVVNIENSEARQSHTKGATVVGLAIDALGVVFAAADAVKFSKAGRQHLFGENRLATTRQGEFRSGSSAQLAGLGGPPGELAKHVQSERPYLDAAGALLKAYLDARKTGEAPDIIERWANALYWFGHARREDTDFIAVVDYGCAADGLSAAGGESKDMANYAAAALGVEVNYRALPEQLSVNDVVTRIYREGRNKLAHGEWPGLFSNHSETRQLGDSFLQALLYVTTQELAEVLRTKPHFLSQKPEICARAFEAHLRNQALGPPAT